MTLGVDSTKVIVTSFGGSRTNFATNEYFIQVSFIFVVQAVGANYLLDQAVSLSESNGTEIRASFNLSAKKIDALIRQKISDCIFGIYNITIDPDDVYIPFAAR